MQRTSPAAFITLKVDVTVNFRPSLSQTRLPLRFSCNTPRSLPAACRTCRFSARCRTSSPRRWAERWWWRRRPWMRPHRDLEPRSHTAHGKHAAKRPRHRFQGFRDFVLRGKKPLNLYQKKTLLQKSVPWCLSVEERWQIWQMTCWSDACSRDTAAAAASGRPDGTLQGAQELGERHRNTERERRESK